MRKLTQKAIDATGYIIVGRSIESITYGSYLSAYGSDETTSPNGVAPRMHIREVVIGETEEPIYSDKDCTIETGRTTTEDIVEYQIWSWGVNGNHPSPTGPTYDNREDAEIEIYEYYEYYIQHKNWNAPQFHNTLEEAMEDMGNMLDRNIEVIKRYISLSEYCSAKARI